MSKINTVTLPPVRYNKPRDEIRCASFAQTMKRVVFAQPDVMLQNHEGYYLHRDVAGLVAALVNQKRAIENLLSDDYGTANARAEARKLLEEWEA